MGNDDDDQFGSCKKKNFKHFVLPTLNLPDLIGFNLRRISILRTAVKSVEDRREKKSKK